MRTKFKVGRAYFVRFLDHTHGSKKLAIVEVIAWCLEDNKDSVVFTAWRLNDEDKSMVANNHEPFTVVKSCIKQKKLLAGV